MPICVLVTGGRHFDDWLTVCQTLDQLNRDRPIGLLIHGAASEADKLAGRWALLRGVPVLACPADWKRRGRATGPVRNRQMLNVHKPDLVVAFPGGRGTANMVSLAGAAGVEVVQIE